MLNFKIVSVQESSPTADTKSITVTHIDVPQITPSIIQNSTQ